MHPSVRKLAAARADVVEPAIAAAYSCLAYVEIVLGPSRPTIESTQALFATLALTVSILASRLFPLASLVVAVSAVVLESWLTEPLTIAPVATLWCSYALALRAPRRRAQWGLLVIWVGIAGYFLGTPPDGVYDVVSTTGIWSTFWAIGYSAARRLEAADRARVAVREQLLAQIPDLDEETLADTLEGLSDLPQMLGEIVRSALEDEALAAAHLEGFIDEIT
ncbi:MAG TPA: hypothetical protein PLZ93_24730, partial [Nocardioides sp.]|nr:hypothetical protein [Nocardioides sp.]